MTAIFEARITLLPGSLKAVSSLPRKPFASVLRMDAGGMGRRISNPWFQPGLPDDKDSCLCCHLHCSKQHDDFVPF